jgi:O-antigen ligase
MRRRRVVGTGSVDDGAFALPLLVLLVVAIGGRFSLARAGVPSLAFIDLRLFGLLVAATLVVVDLARRSKRAAWTAREAWIGMACLFFGYQLLSVLWAPDGARTDAKGVDLGVMAALTFLVYVQARRDARRAVRLALWFSYAAALVWAAGAFATGPGLQNRYAAFGGGPNVFVRVEVVGIISAIALRALGTSRWVLLGVPPMAASALLSGSRGGLLAAAVTGVVALVVRRTKLSPARAILLVGLAAVLLLAGLRYLPPGIHELVDTRYGQQTFATHYLSGRPHIWAQAIDLAQRHPLTGTGLDGFYATVGAAEDVQYPHNYLLGVAAEGGAFGLVLLGATVTLWLIGLAGRWRRRRIEVMACVGVAAFVALSSLTSGDNYDSRMAWVFAALAAAAAVAPSGASAQIGGSRGGSRRGSARPGARVPVPTSLGRAGPDDRDEGGRLCTDLSKT